MIVVSPIANMYKEPSFSSEMITQSLMGEELEVLEIFENWVKVKQWDGYISWVNKFYLVDENLKKYSNYTNVTNTFETLLSSIDPYRTLGQISFGTSLPVISETEYEVIVELPTGEKANLHQQEGVNSLDIRNQIAYFTQKLIGIPYVWGGKSAFGFDCSGFVQTIFKLMDIELPRDSGPQAQFSSLLEINVDELEVGDLLFFAEKDNISHVAISLGRTEYIHCSGMVKINSINPNSELFNENLQNWLINTKSIKGLL